MLRPGGDFMTIVASTTFAVVPRGRRRRRRRRCARARSSWPAAATGWSSGSPTTLELEANEAYWAGPPALGSITLVTDLGGASEVEAFADGDLDYAPISSFDAGWIAYDADLGPSLREVPSLSTNYYGFDTRSAPFDDVRVRQAFAAAVDWRRIARLSEPDPAALATSMVPPGIPGRSEAGHAAGLRPGLPAEPCWPRPATRAVPASRTWS